MFSREQILNLMRDKVTHPATPRELLRILKVPPDERPTVVTGLLPRRTTKRAAAG